jgi:hypothetical protein
VKSKLGKGYKIPKRQVTVISEAMQHLRSHLEKTYGGFPEDYLCIDTETTGFKKEDDLIWNLGASLAGGRKEVRRVNIILNWTEHPLIDQNWLERKIRYTREQMRAGGRECHLTWEALTEGVKPEEGMEAFGDLLVESRKAHIPILGHGIVKFDAPRISRQLEEWIGLLWKFRRDETIDTAAIEKACESGMKPKSGESYFDFSKRVLNKPMSGVKWNLDTHCLNKYQLQKKGVDPSKLHWADSDAYLCHLVFEEYRQICGL